MSGKIGQTGGTPSSGRPSEPDRKQSEKAAEKDVEKLGSILDEKGTQRKEGEKKDGAKPKEDPAAERMAGLSKDILSKEAGKLSPKEQVIKEAILGQNDKLGSGKEKKSELSKESLSDKRLSKDDLSGGKISERSDAPPPIQGQTGAQAQPTPVQGAQEGQKVMAPSDVGKMATELVDKMLLTHPESKTGVQEARITLKNEVGGSLRGTEVLVRTEKVGDKIQLQIGFTVSNDNPSAFGVLRSGQEGLTQQLKSQLPDTYDLKGVDINQGGGDDRQSKGQYIPEPTDTE